MTSSAAWSHLPHLSHPLVTSPCRSAAFSSDEFLHRVPVQEPKDPAENPSCGSVSPIEKQRGASSKVIEVPEQTLAPVLALLLWDTFAGK